LSDSFLTAKHSYFLPWLVLFVCLGITYQLWQKEQDDTLSRLSDDFDTHVLDGAERIKQRMATYELVLRGVQGLFVDKVDRAGFARFVENLHLADSYPGIQGVGFSIIVPPDKKQLHIQKTRDQFRRTDIAPYTIWPAGERSFYTSILYLEPFSGRNLRALGYDMYSEPVRRQAMDQARDSDRAALSGRVTLVQETGQDVQYGCLMYLPVYKKNAPHETLVQRRTNITGWVYAPFRMKDLLRGVRGAHANNLNFEIYDGALINEKNRMHNTDGKIHTTARFTSVQPLNIAGHRWTLQVYADIVSNDNRARLIAQAGTTLSVLLSLVIWLLVNGRMLAISLAHQMNRNLTATLQAIPDLLFELDGNGRYLNIWAHSPELLAAQKNMLLGHTVSEMLPQEAAGVVMAAIKEAEEMLCSQGKVIKLRLPQGDSWFELSTSRKTPDEEGRISYLMLSRDITERQQLENDLRESEARMRVMVENDLVGIARVKDRAIIWANPAYEKALGYERGELNNKPTRMLYVSDEDYQSLGEKYIPVIRNGGIFRCEQELVRKDGKRITVHLNGAQLNSQTGESLLIFMDITGRKRTELMLRKLSTAVEQSPVSIVITDLSGSMEYVNPRFCQVTGYSANEAIGKNPRILKSDKTPGEVYRELWDKLTSGQVWRGELINRKKDGQLYWEEVQLSPVKNANGDIINYVGIKSDITLRKELEKAVAESELRYRTLADFTSDWEYWIMPDGTFRYLSNTCEKISGYTPDEFNADPQLLLTLVHQDDLSGFLEHTQGLSEHTVPINFRMRTKGGEWRWIAHVCRVVFDANGQPDGRRASNRDITEQKLLEDERRIAAIAFESQEGMSITDVNGVILRVNRAFTGITGYAAEEVIGKRSNIFKSGRHNKDFYDLMWQNINKTGAWEGEIWNRRRNGEIYPGHITITAVKDQAGIVTHYVSSLTDITLTKATENEIKHLAFYDPLTLLPNRRLLLDRLRQALTAVGRTDHTGALLFIDLDNFKNLNDTLGHDIGDLLLQQVARRLESCIRAGDTVARLGGDEFVVMLEELDSDMMVAAEQTEVIGNKILVKLNEPYQLSIHAYRNTPSIGATLFNRYTLSADEVLKQADIAMYQSKKAGRNNMHFFDQKMQTAVNNRAALENELRIALLNNQFELYYQIQVVMKEGVFRAVGAEALLRWHHPEHGLLLPETFMAMAEETGLILPLAHWVLNAACAQLAAWQKNEVTQVLTLAVNLCGKCFSNPGFAGELQTELQNNAIQGKRLRFELTESLLQYDIEEVVATMTQLDRLGVRFSLDNFGTGYSSLKKLKLLPFDQLKIDLSFVQGIEMDSSDQMIVRTIIAMAKSLNMEVVAEGVETKAQLKLLLNDDCQYFQGYLFGKPMPVEQFEALLVLILNPLEV
jgi:diguanylate cyclase (GGDEF)-like protein/PAS domain S-box-containing protein